MIKKAIVAIVEDGPVATRFNYDEKAQILFQKIEVGSKNITFISIYYFVY